MERYLAECLESIASQTMSDIEVVVVDDGATDGTGELVEKTAAADKRFRILHQENKGLGHARNRGVGETTADLIVFIDGDDVVPPDAFSLMVGTLKRTESAFVAGNVARYSKAGLTPSKLHQEAFAKTRLKTSVVKFPALLYDRTATNKVWRRAFWDKHRFAFPEGVLYEDIAVTIPAYALADQVDVLNEDVYWWRIRDRQDGPSITQDRLEIRHVEDRIAALETVSNFLADHKPELQGRFHLVVLRNDLPIFLNLLERADVNYRQFFLERSRSFLARIGEPEMNQLPAIDRVKYGLVKSGTADQVVDIVAYQRQLSNEHPSVEIDGRFHGAYPFRDVLPPGLYLLDDELVLRAGIDRIWWVGDHLHVRGWAYLELIDLSAGPRSQVNVWIEEVGGERRHEFEVRAIEDPLLWRESRDPLRSYRAGGFEGTLPVRKLVGPDGWKEGVWRFFLSVADSGVVRTVRLGSPRRGAPERPVGQELAKGWLAAPTYNQAQELTLRIENRTVALRGVRVVDGNLELRLQGSIPIEAELQLVAGAEERRYPLPNNRSQIPQTDLAGKEWRVFVASGETATRVEVLSPDYEHVFAPEEIVVHRTRYGNLSLISRMPFPTIDRVRWKSKGRLLVDGSHYAGSPHEVVLVARGRKEEVGFPLTVTKASFSAELELGSRQTLAGPVPLRAGHWDFRLRTKDGELQRLKLNHRLIDDLPVNVVCEGKTFSFGDQTYDTPLLVVDNDLTPEERGAYPQRRLQKEFYPLRRSQPLKECVLYDSYTGKQFSDSPRAIYEQLVAQHAAVDHKWVVRDRQVTLPHDLDRVRYTGRDYYEAFATSRYIITNAHLPAWFERRPGQVVVQTWHGTPLKRIGHDIPSIRFATTDYKERIAHEVENWSYLVSPNPFSSPILKKAFRFEGELLQIGYPRNDLFHRPGNRAEAIKSRLRIPPDRRVILYAPTWRDDRFYGRGRYRFDMKLDVDALRSKLGSDHVLLVRRHPNVVDRIGGDDFLIDVGDYPEVNELLLAADVLVTDYSSVLFDYANLRRPMIFFTYDLEEYRDVLRGFYFDFVKKAPGPLLATSDEVVDALADPKQGFDGEKVDAFAKEFCVWDDGHASKRLIDKVFSNL